MSESTHVKMPHCCKSHVTAQMLRLMDKKIITIFVPNIFGYIDLTNASFKNKTSIANFQLETNSKTCIKRPLSTQPKIVFQPNYRLMQVKSIVECSKGEHSAIHPTFIRLPLAIKVFVLSILSGCFTQVLLYCEKNYDCDVNSSRKAMTSCSCTGKWDSIFLYYHMDLIPRKPNFVACK